MSMYLRQQWTDSRLQYNASEMLKQIELDNAIKTEIWVPDLSFMTDMDTKFHEVTVPNKMNIFICCIRIPYFFYLVHTS
jgi:hypothetical protein